MFSECSFSLRSIRKKSGWLYSPNYPGFYPRNTDCEYEFHGVEGELVSIQFTYFDVEGTSGRSVIGARVEHRREQAKQPLVGSLQV